MNIPKTRPALLWQSSLQDIRACRAEPLQDYDIVWLWQLAQRVVSPADSRLPFTRAPIRCGNVWLYRLSLQGLNWLATIDPWWPGSDLLPAAYACAHSTDKPEPLFQVTDRAVIQSTIAAWADTLDCTLEDLRLATQIQTGFPDAIVNTDPKPREPSGREASIPAPSDLDATQWGAILALLAGAYSIPPWQLLLRPFDDIKQLLAQLPAIATLYGNIPNDKQASSTLQEFHEAVRFLKTGHTSASVPSAPSVVNPVPSPPLCSSVPSASSVVDPSPSPSPPLCFSAPSVVNPVPSPPIPNLRPPPSDLSAVASAKAELSTPNSALRTQNPELRNP